MTDRINPTTDQQELGVEEYHPRKPLVAFLLSVFFTGLGQIYNGQLKKGLFFFFLAYVILLVCSAFNFISSFSGFIVVFGLLISIKLYAIIDSFIVARKLKLYIRATYNTWYFHLLFACTAVGVSVTYDIQTIIGVRTFILPTTSNYPTTLVGDRVFVDLDAYRSGKVNCGDMVVFYSPQSEVWTFRVIGMPGDKIEIKNRELIINGVNIKTTYEREAVDGDYEVQQYLEELPNGFKHSIYRYKMFTDSSYSNMPEVTVPIDSYFLLGDNRDNAYDSRYIGVVKKTDIFAQMMYIFWSPDFDRIGLDFRKSK